MSTTVMEMDVIIGAKDEGYKQKMKEIPTFAAKIGQMVSNATKTFFGIKAVGALVNFGKQTVQTGMQFDASMAQVAATMGKTVDEIQNLRDFAQEMGRTTAFSASQAADALNYMALAGYDADTSMKMLPTVLDLAAAGTMDLATASDMVTDTQTALGLSIEQTATMVDQMAKASSRSNTSVSQLGEAMLALGATGRNVAGGTTELSTVLGVLADNGIKGSEGGTKLRNILLSIQGKKFDKTFKQLGVEVYDASGELRAMPDILADMNKAMDGMTTAEKQNLISNTFNRGDMAAVNALLGTTTERWGELTEAIEDSEGAAAQMAETQLDNLQGDVIILKSAWEGFQIALSDKVTPALRSLAQVATEVVSRITALLSGEGSGIGEALKSLTEKFGLNSLEIQEKFAQIGTKVRQVMGSIQAIIDLAWQFISNVWKKYGDDIMKFAGTTFKQILDIISVGMEYIRAVIKLVLGFIRNIWDEWGTTITAIVSYVWARIKTTISTTLDVIKGIIKLATALITGDWKGAWEAIKNIFTTIMNAIKQATNDSFEFMKNIFNIGLNAISSTVESLLGSIKEKFSSAFEIVKNTVSSAIEFIKGLFHFEWSLPPLKLPHFSVEGQFSLMPPSVPKFNIQWYRKAYDSPMLFTQPTVIPVGNKLKGFGDGNGGELVIGMHKLKELVGNEQGFIQNITINAPRQLDPSEISRQTRNANREMVLALKGLR